MDPPSVGCSLGRFPVSLALRLGVGVAASERAETAERGKGPMVIPREGAEKVTVSEFEVVGGESPGATGTFNRLSMLGPAVGSLETPLRC